MFGWRPSAFFPVVVRYYATWVGSFGLCGLIPLLFSVASSSLPLLGTGIHPVNHQKNWGVCGKSTFEGRYSGFIYCSCAFLDLLNPTPGSSSIPSVLPRRSITLATQSLPLRIGPSYSYGIGFSFPPLLVCSRMQQNGTNSTGKNQQRFLTVLFPTVRYVQWWG